MNAAPLTERFNVRRYGSQGPLLLFGHGFCTDSHVFKHQVDVLSQDHQVITYDLAGFGQADPALFDPARHHRLEGYAEDLVALLDELDLQDVTLIGASMSAVVSLLASLACPARIRALVLICASPRYLNDAGYTGGFGRAEVDAFYESIEAFEAWSSGLADALVGPSSVALRETLERVRRVAPEVVRTVARAIFESDARALLPRCTHPVLLVHSEFDSMVPESVERYLTRNLQHARLVKIPGVGHLPHRTQPELFNKALKAFVREVSGAAPALTFA
ncbi:MAG: alpha/beta hydrolase [Deinococcota bacterium]